MRGRVSRSAGINRERNGSRWEWVFQDERIRKLTSSGEEIEYWGKEGIEEEECRDQGWW